MNAVQLNTRLIDFMKDKVKENELLANVILEVLPLGKEAVYRRLRNDVLFTFSEIVVLAKHFGISLDELSELEEDKDIKYCLEYVSIATDESKLYNQLVRLNNFFKEYRDDPNSSMVYASNYFNSLTFINYKYLSKIYVYKSLCQNIERSKIVPFNEFQLSADYLKIMQKIFSSFRKIMDICYIWDNVIFQSLINDIKYLHEAYFITDNDLLNLKEDLLWFICDIEKLTNSVSPIGRKVSVYVSETIFQSTYAYIEGTNKQATIIGTVGASYLLSKQKKAAEYMKTWIQSIKRVSSLISDSGQIQSKKFIDKQKRLIESLSVRG